MFVLFGAPGAGKSTLGKAVAKKLKLPFFDIDTLLEKESGITKSVLWKSLGEKKYRELESAIVQRLSLGIIACGGGTVLDPRNVAHLQTLGQMVYLFCPIEILIKRFFQTSRAMLQTKSELKQLLEQRIPIYEKIKSMRIDSSQSIEWQVEMLINE